MGSFPSGDRRRIAWLTSWEGLMRRRPSRQQLLARRSSSFSSCSVRDLRRHRVALGAPRSLAGALGLWLRVVCSRRSRLRPSGEVGDSGDPTSLAPPFSRRPLPPVVGLVLSRAFFRAEADCTSLQARCERVVRRNLACRRALLGLASALVGTRALCATCPHICFARQTLSIVVTALMRRRRHLGVPQTLHLPERLAALSLRAFASAIARPALAPCFAHALRLEGRHSL